MRIIVTTGIALALLFSAVVAMGMDEMTGQATDKADAVTAATQHECAGKECECPKKGTVCTLKGNGCTKKGSEAAACDNCPEKAEGCEAAACRDCPRRETGCEAAPVFVPKSEQEKASYAYGANIGRSLKAGQAELDVEAFIAGIKAALAGEELALGESEMREAMMKYSTRMRAKQRAQAAAEQAKREAEWAKENPELAKEKADLAKKNAEEGAAFLAANAKKEGVITLKSGLQYKVIKAGDGPSPKATDIVSTHYRGRFVNGTEFDSSYGRGEPASFPVNGVIAGWTEALQLMKVGSKWELFVPSKLAYGKAGRAGGMPPNATLIFEVELLSIQGMDAKSQ